MKKFLLFGIALVFLSGVFSAPAWACCYLNEDIHNGSGEPAWDLLIIFCAEAEVIETFGGYADAYHFRQVQTWKEGGKTYLRYFDPADGAGNPDSIPPCEWVHIGYWLDGPVPINEKIWTDKNGNPLPNGHIQNPSHWVYYRDYSERQVVLTLTNDQTGVPPEYPPCPDPTVISDVYYAILSEEIPLDELNARNSTLMAMLQPLPGGTGPFVIVLGDRITLPIPEPMEPGEVLVYRFNGLGISEFMSFGQHEMDPPGTAPCIFLETPTFPPPENPVPCDILHEIYPNFCDLWHVLEWEKEPGTYGGHALLDPEPFEGMGESFEFCDLIIMTAVDQTTGLDTLKLAYEGPFGDITTLPVVSTQWHEIWPFFSNEWHIVDWIDNGDGYLSTCDYVRLGLKPAYEKDGWTLYRDLRWVHVTTVCTGAKIVRPKVCLAVGAEHAHSDGVAVTSRASVIGPPCPIFAATAGTAVACPGLAFGAGAGWVDCPPCGPIFVAAAAAAVLIPKPAPCCGPPLHAWGLGFASDPPPDPCVDPFDDAALMGIFGETGTIPDVPSLTEQQFRDSLATYPIDPCSPGAEGYVAVDALFDNPGDQIIFSFRDTSQLTIERSGLSTYSISLCVSSDTLGIKRTLTTDESGSFTFSGGWAIGDIVVTETGGRLEITGMSGLDFSVSVGASFTECHFENLDIDVQVIATASIETETPAHTYLETWTTPPYVPPANPVPCDILHEILPVKCRLWHVLKWEKAADGTHGGAVLDLEPFEGAGVCYRFFDLMMMTVVDSATGGDTLKVTYDGPFGAVDTLQPVNTQWHELKPFFSRRWKILVWIDNGDGHLSDCDYLVIGLKPYLTCLRLVHVIDVRTGAKIALAEQVPAVSHWGLVVLVALLAVTAVWLIRRRKRFETLVV